MIVKAEDMLIASCEERTSKKTGNDYLLVRVDDGSGYPASFMDRNLDNKDSYKPGKSADFELNLVITRDYTSMSVRKVTIK